MLVFFSLQIVLQDGGVKILKFPEEEGNGREV
jgi:hypothetical protein